MSGYVNLVVSSPWGGVRKLLTWDIMSFVALDARRGRPAITYIDCDHYDGTMK